MGVILNPKDAQFQNSEYKVDQVGSKDSGSQNFKSLANEEKALGAV
jgi:hypothetical protein